MGGANGKQLIKKYWVDSKKGLTVSQDDRAIKRCFESYDQNKSGALEIDEALAYINDLLRYVYPYRLAGDPLHESLCNYQHINALLNRVSGLDKRIYEEAATAAANPPDYYGQYVMNIFKEMDKNGTGSIAMADLLKPKETIWSSFLRFVSVKTLHEAKKKAKGEPVTKAGTNDDSESFSIDSDDLKSSEEEIPKPKPKKTKKAATDDTTNATATKANSKKIEAPELKKKKPKTTTQGEATGAAPYKDPETTKPQPSALDRAKSKSVGRAALTESGLMQMRDTQVEAVVEILGTEYSTAQKLLNFYRWVRIDSLQLPLRIKLKLAQFSG